MPDTFTKDPLSVKDYTFDWSSWLATSELILTGSVTATSGITAFDGNITDSGTSYTIWLASGVSYNDYYVTNEIVTNQGRVELETVTIFVRPT